MLYISPSCCIELLLFSPIDPLYKFDEITDLDVLASSDFFGEAYFPGVVFTVELANESEAESSFAGDLDEGFGGCGGCGGIGDELTAEFSVKSEIFDATEI